MKKIIIWLMAFISLTITEISIAQWLQTSNGISGTSVNSFTVKGSVLYAGGNDIYKTTDLGLNWLSISHNSGILASNNNYLFAGGTGYIYRSSDNGLNWSNIGPPNQCIKALEANGNFIFTGTDICGQANTHNLYVSADNGSTWTLKIINYLVKSFTINNNIVFAGTTGGVYRSTDNGSSWNISSNGMNQPIYSVASNGTDVYASTYFNGVYRSTDNGLSWIQTALVIQDIYTLAAYGNTVFAGTYNSGVYASANNGSTWIQWNDGLPSTQIYKLFIFSNYIFSGTQGFNVYRRPLGELNGIEPVSSEIPEGFSLSQNYPNPFNPTTKIKFEIPAAGNGRDRSAVQIAVYDISGRLVETLVNENLSPGTYEVTWSAGNYSTGVYYYKLLSGEYSETKKMILLR
jgi:type IX secretion system substrate protein